MKAPWRAGCLLALLIATQGYAADEPADEPRWQAGVGFDYWKGDYGGDQDTTFTYVPLTLKRFLPRGNVSLTVPYVAIDGPGGAVIIDGGVNAGGGAGTSSGSGLGDIVIRGLYEALYQDGWRPNLDLVAKVKLPTADEGEGLGTGEADYGVGVELSLGLDEARRYLALADLYYTFIGSPPGEDYDNQFAFDIGLGYQVTPALLASVYFNYRTALVGSNDDPASVLLYGSYRIDGGWSADLGFEFGLTDGEADWGVLTGIRKRF